MDEDSQTSDGQGLQDQGSHLAHYLTSGVLDELEEAPNGLHLAVDMALEDVIKGGRLNDLYATPQVAFTVSNDIQWLDQVIDSLSQAIDSSLVSALLGICGCFVSTVVKVKTIRNA